MFLICAQKTLWGLGLILLAALLVFLHAEQLTQPFQLLFGNELAEDPHDLLANLLIGIFPTVSLRTELLLAAGAAIYAVLEFVEAWGLWRDIHWVEALIVIETAAFLPYELWELARSLSPFKVASLVINVLIVWYLVRRYLKLRTAHQAKHGNPLATQ